MTIFDPVASRADDLKIVLGLVSAKNAGFNPVEACRCRAHSSELLTVAVANELAVLETSLDTTDTACRLL